MCHLLCFSTGKKIRQTTLACLKSPQSNTCFTFFVNDEAAERVCLLTAELIAERAVRTVDEEASSLSAIDFNPVCKKINSQNEITKFWF